MEAPALLPPLPFTLDLSCPISLPQKPIRGPTFAIAWPFPVAGPSTALSETLDECVKRRYYETLYLGEILFPIAGLIADLERAAASHNDILDPLIAARLLTLQDIESRHRRTLLPVIAAAMAAVDTSGDIDNHAAAAGLTDAERDVLSTAVDMRMKCRAVAEGERGLPVKALGDEFERRELLIQLVLLLFYRGRNPAPAKKKKRRRDSKLASPTNDPDTTLELFADRVGVWLAVAELGIGEDMSSKGKDKEDEHSVSLALQQFWDKALVPCFLSREPAYLSVFHLKVFGKPIPAGLIPQKKPRKPKVTRRLSIDESAPRPAPKMQRTSSKATTNASPPPEPDRSIRRSNSRASDQFDRRQRSSSIDPSTREPSRVPGKPIVRAPSGKHLFKGREVGLLRRSSSILARHTSVKEEKGPVGPGLLGRKSAGESLRRHESLSHAQTQSQTKSETLIFATPAKSKQHFGRGVFPTPIREEPSSGGSTLSFVTETPMVGRLLASVAETPRRDVVSETPVAARTALAPYESDDDLGELMVPTDDEDDERMFSVPDTPARRL